MSKDEMNKVNVAPAGRGKIATKTVIKEVKAKKGGMEIKFGRVHFSDEQTQKLLAMAEEEAEVTVTIEAAQKELPGTT